MYYSVDVVLDTPDQTQHTRGSRDEQSAMDFFFGVLNNDGLDGNRFTSLNLNVRSTIYGAGNEGRERGNMGWQARERVKREKRSGNQRSRRNPIDLDPPQDSQPEPYQNDDDDDNYGEVVEEQHQDRGDDDDDNPPPFDDDDYGRRYRQQDNRTKKRIRSVSGAAQEQSRPRRPARPTKVVI